MDPPTPGKDPDCFNGGSFGEQTSYREARVIKDVDHVVNVCGCSQMGKGKTQPFIKTPLPLIRHCGLVVHSVQSYAVHPSKCGPAFPLEIDPALLGPTGYLTV